MTPEGINKLLQRGEGLEVEFKESPLDGSLSVGNYVSDLDSKYESTQVKKDKNIIDDTVNDTVNDTVKQRLVRIIALLYQRPGMKKGQLMKEFGLAEITFKRDIQKLKGLVEYRGPQKSGGYFLTHEMENKLKG